MKIKFLGATGTVTGSKYLLTIQNKHILVDCGLFQGFKELRLRNWDRLPIAPSDIDAVVLTHAHIDHTGYIPLLVKNGFKGTIYATKPTCDLCAILLPDSGYLQEEDARLANLHGYSKHHPALPLYTVKDAEKSLEHFKPMQFSQEYTLAPGIQISWHRAGHILGAAFVRFEVESKELDEPSPKIIVAASGMMTGGRVLHHLKTIAPDPRNTILMTGYQAGGTRGADLLAGGREIKIHGEVIAVKAQVVSLNSLSAHADYEDSLYWLKQFQRAPRKLFITHGEPEAADALKKCIEKELGWSCEIPTFLEEVTLG